MSLPGDLIFDPYQYEFRGLLFGSRTSYMTEKVTGLHAMPGITDVDVARGAEHGSFPSLLLMTKRIVQFDMKILGRPGADIEQKLAIARRTFQVPRKRYSTIMEPFVFWRPGEPKKALYVRCTKRDFPSDYDTAHGLSAGSVELTAPYPIISGLDVKNASWNLGIGVVTANQIITNEGDYVDGANPVVTITGPWTNPRIQNATDDGRTLRFDIVLAAGDALRLSAATMKAELRVGLGGAWVDAYSYVRSDNQWWAVLPGANTIVASRTNSAAQGTVTVAWQDAYA